MLFSPPRLNRLGDEGGKMLLEGVAENDTLRQLNLSCNALEMQSASVAAGIIANRLVAIFVELAPNCNHPNSPLVGKSLPFDVAPDSFQHTYWHAAAVTVICMAGTPLARPFGQFTTRRCGEAIAGCNELQLELNGIGLATQPGDSPPLPEQVKQPCLCLCTVLPFLVTFMSRASFSVALPIVAPAAFAHRSQWTPWQPSRTCAKRMAYTRRISDCNEPSQRTTAALSLRLTAALSLRL